MKCLLSLFLVTLLNFGNLLPVNAQTFHGNKIFEDFIMWFTGDFSSVVNGHIDSTDNGLRMHHMIINTWELTDSSAWVYEEIDFALHEEKIYRQLVWQIIELPDRTLKTRQYLVTKPWLFAGAWKSEYLMKQLSSEYLADSSVCNLTFVYNEKRFFLGDTPKQGCPNHYKKAIKFTSQDCLDATQYEFWERGWDSDNNIVWGDKVSGIQFARKPF